VNIFEIPCNKQCCKNSGGYCTVNNYLDVFGDDLCLMQGYFVFGMDDKSVCVLQAKP